MKLMIFFVNVGPNTEIEVPKAPNMPPEYFLKNRKQFNFIIVHISNEEILEIIESLPNKATGPTSIPLNLLRIVAELIVFPLCHIVAHKRCISRNVKNCEGNVTT